MDIIFSIVLPEPSFIIKLILIVKNHDLELWQEFISIY